MLYEEDLMRDVATTGIDTCCSRVLVERPRYLDSGFVVVEMALEHLKGFKPLAGL